MQSGDFNKEQILTDLRTWWRVSTYNTLHREDDTDEKWWAGAGPRLRDSYAVVYQGNTSIWGRKVTPEDLKKLWRTTLRYSLDQILHYVKATAGPNSFQMSQFGLDIYGLQPENPVYAFIKGNPANPLIADSVQVIPDYIQWGKKHPFEETFFGVNRDELEIALNRKGKPSNKFKEEMEITFQPAPLTQLITSTQPASLKGSFPKATF